MPELDKIAVNLLLSSSNPRPLTRVAIGSAGLRLQPLLDRISLHFQLDGWMPTCCSMAVATAAAMQGIPAGCARSMEAAPRRSTWV